MTVRTDATIDLAGQLRLELTRRRERVLEEIRAHPPAVPACDAQFNHLLEQRDALGRELDRLEDILNADLSLSDREGRLADFRRRSALLRIDPADA